MNLRPPALKTSKLPLDQIAPTSNFTALDFSQWVEISLNACLLIRCLNYTNCNVSDLLLHFSGKIQVDLFYISILFSCLYHQCTKRLYVAKITNAAKIKSANILPSTVYIDAENNSDRLTIFLLKFVAIFLSILNNFFIDCVYFCDIVV